jgi:hypothetical protein
MTTIGSSPPAFELLTGGSNAPRIADASDDDADALAQQLRDLASQLRTQPLAGHAGAPVLRLVR